MWLVTLYGQPGLVVVDPVAMYGHKYATGQSQLGTAYWSLKSVVYGDVRSNQVDLVPEPPSSAADKRPS